MAHYTRFWNCGKCGKRVESIDYPKVELCDACDAPREKLILHVIPAFEGWSARESWAWCRSMLPDQDPAAHAEVRVPQPEGRVLTGWWVVSCTKAGGFVEVIPRMPDE